MLNRVFVVYHTHILPSGEEDVKLIGVYSTRGNAERAVTRTSRLPGFSQAPDRFSVDEYLLDEDHWTAGYVTVSPE